jgi:hypothetical protein
MAHAHRQGALPRLNAPCGPPMSLTALQSSGRDHWHAIFRPPQRLPHYGRTTAQRCRSQQPARRRRSSRPAELGAAASPPRRSRGGERTHRCRRRLHGPGGGSSSCCCPCLAARCLARREERIREQVHVRRHHRLEGPLAPCRPPARAGGAQHARLFGARRAVSGSDWSRCCWPACRPEQGSGKQSGGGREKD